MRVDQRTKDDVARRIAQGHSRPEIIRCLKRLVAREIHYLLRPPTQANIKSRALDKKESIDGAEYTSTARIAAC